MKIFTQKIVFIFFILLINDKVYPQWAKVAEVSGSGCILPVGNIILVGTNNGVYRSIDNGLSWSHYTVDNSYPIITDLANNDDYIFAGTFNGVYSSADTGKTWRNLGPSYSILSVFAKDSVILACIHGGGLFQSVNNGQSWTPINGDHYYAYMLHNNSIFTGTFGGIYESTDNGLTWNFVDLPNKIVTSLSKNDKYFFATNYTDGIYRSDDYGRSWSSSNQGLPLDLFHPYSVFAKDSLIFAGLTSKKIYLSVDNGFNWQVFSDGLDINEETYNVKFGISGNKIFANFVYNSLWYYDLSQITSLSESSSSTPEGFFLQQNYPNPFNQSTKIVYSVPKANHVMLKIYDVLGNEIIALVNDFQMADTYTVNFNASNLASSIYFYKIKIGNDFVQTRKMLLIR